MAKPFGKKVNDWLKTQETQEYLSALQRIAVRFDKNRNVDSLIVTKQGGNVAEIEQGTWATYLKELHKQIQEIATFSEVVKTEFERVIHSLSE